MSEIVFDLDGTLLDSASRHVTLLRQLCDDRGLSLDDYLLCKSNGMNTYSYLTKVKNLSEELAQNIVKRWTDEIEKPELLNEDSLYPDALPALQECKKLFRLILISCRKSESLFFLQVDKLGIAPFFDKIVCVRPGESKCVAARKFDYIKCWIGDTETDGDAARELGVPFYALNRGFRSKAYWTNAGVESFSDFSDLQKFIMRYQQDVKRE